MARRSPQSAADARAEPEPARLAVEWTDVGLAALPAAVAVGGTLLLGWGVAGVLLAGVLGCAGAYAVRSLPSLRARLTQEVTRLRSGSSTETVGRALPDRIRRPDALSDGGSRGIRAFHEDSGVVERDDGLLATLVRIETTDDTYPDLGRLHRTLGDASADPRVAVQLYAGQRRYSPNVYVEAREETDLMEPDDPLFRTLVDHRSGETTGLETATAGTAETYALLTLAVDAETADDRQTTLVECRDRFVDRCDGVDGVHATADRTMAGWFCLREGAWNDAVWRARLSAGG